MEKKRYGLQAPKKAALGEVQPRHSAFDDDSDSEHEDGSDWVKKAFSKAASKSVPKKQTKLEVQRALKEDPTVYQYDEIYEQLEVKKQEAKSEKTAQERKPRYIQTLMAHAEQRKREQERRMERQVQKEREAEGEAFKDKEAFITSSYRKKLEEFRKLDEEERRRDELEAIGEVSKQEDLSGFYRHLFHQTLGESKPIIKQEEDSGGEEAGIERNMEEPDKTQSVSLKKLDSSPTVTSKAEGNRDKTDHAIVSHMTDQAAVSEIRKISTSCNDTEEEASKDDLEDREKIKQSPPLEISHKVVFKKQHANESNQDADTDISSSSSESGSETVETKTDSSRRKKNQTTRSRQYRKRQSSSSEESSSGAENEKSTVLLENGTDKDTEVSTRQITSKAEEKAEINTSSALNEKKIEGTSKAEKEKKNRAEKENKGEKENESNIEKEDKSEKTKKVPDLSIYKKRTVGAKFEEARRKYLERKAEREAKNIIF